MATLWINEYDNITMAGGVVVQLAKEPAVTSQIVTYTTSTASNAFNDNTKFIRVIAGADVYLSFGASPTATATSLYLPSGTVEYFAVTAGQKVAAYDGTS